MTVHIPLGRARAHVGRPIRASRSSRERDDVAFVASGASFLFIMFISFFALDVLRKRAFVSMTRVLASIDIAGNSMTMAMDVDRYVDRSDSDARAPRVMSRAREDTARESGDGRRHARSSSHASSSSSSSSSSIERERARGRRRGREDANAREDTGARARTTSACERETYERGMRPTSTLKGGEGHERERRDGARGDAGASADRSLAPSLASHGNHEASFALSGALARESNSVRGVALKYVEPRGEAKVPREKWRLYCFKGDDASEEPYRISSRTKVLFGRDRAVADIPTDHPSCSKQHCVLQFRDVDDGAGAQPYAFDLGSTNGTFVNNARITAETYVKLKVRDTLRFGHSTRVYVLLHEDV